VYLASAPKDRRSYDAYFAALEDAKRYGNAEVPMFLRNAPTQLMKQMGYGAGERDSYLPKPLLGKKYYRGEG
jgi:putative ATPase